MFNTFPWTLVHLATHLSGIIPCPQYTLVLFCILPQLSPSTPSEYSPPRAALGCLLVSMPHKTSHFTGAETMSILFIVGCHSLALGLAHKWCSINICWTDAWMNVCFAMHKTLCQVAAELTLISKNYYVVGQTRPKCTNPDNRLWSKRTATRESKTIFYSGGKASRDKENLFGGHRD